MPSPRPVQLTFNVHPQLAVDARRLVELLFTPDHRGLACRAAVRRLADAGFPPIESYQGNIFRLDLRGPEVVHGLDRDYDGAFLTSDAYSDHLSSDHASAIAELLRLDVDQIIGRYAAKHELFRVGAL